MGNRNRGKQQVDKSNVFAPCTLLPITISCPATLPTSPASLMKSKISYFNISQEHSEEQPKNEKK